MNKLNQLQLTVLRAAARQPDGRIIAGTAPYNTLMALWRRNLIDRHNTITAKGREAIDLVKPPGGAA